MYSYKALRHRSLLFAPLITSALLRHASLFGIQRKSPLEKSRGLTDSGRRPTLPHSYPCIFRVLAESQHRAAQDSVTALFGLQKKPTRTIERAYRFLAASYSPTQLLVHR